MVTYTVKRELGGACTFAPVHLIENSTALAMEEEDNVDENMPVARVGKDSHRAFKVSEAIKMEEPTSTWEFFILRSGAERVEQEIANDDDDDDDDDDVDVDEDAEEDDEAKRYCPRCFGGVGR
ncbi:unnamed protein product [Zymoseptoria tritici ST99CH_1E4]|uniref:Uncharacterized protein n=1 Tax=Zymoseptoria tritici ST99CH_1E4 TaxID=1276532 RepID=A0A2H1HBU5_ZYMTR|nr:unnamed protein product [Zymoseptoria tritici ST99CH_1E4]